MHHVSEPAKTKNEGRKRTSLNSPQTIQLPSIPLLKRNLNAILQRQSLSIQLPHRRPVFLISIRGRMARFQMRRLVRVRIRRPEGLGEVRREGVGALDQGIGPLGESGA